jgi:hypothetical protein
MFPIISPIVFHDQDITIFMQTNAFQNKAYALPEGIIIKTKIIMKTKDNDE